MGALLARGDNGPGVSRVLRFRHWTVYVAGIIAVQGALTLLVPRGLVLTTVVNCITVTLFAVSLLTGIRSARAAEGRLKLAWILFASSWALFEITQLVWMYFEIVLRREVPNPFVGDILYFVALVPLMGMLLLRPHVQPTRRDVRLVTADLLLLLVGWLYIYAYLVIPWQYISPNIETYGPAFNWAALSEDLVLVAVTTGFWLATEGAWKRFYSHFAAAALLYAVTNGTINVAIDYNFYYTGSWYDLPSSVALGWFSIVAVSGYRLPQVLEEASRSDELYALWVARIASVVRLALPALAAWTYLDNSLPSPVRQFRLLLTLGTMLVMGLLATLKQHRADMELSRVNQELREASLTDILTGVRNRRFFSAHIAMDVEQALRAYAGGQRSKRNQDLIFYFIDADHFKEINDRFGHDVGDQVLVEITRRLSSAIRHSDVLIRWGGEEFLVVSRQTDRRDAATLAARVLDAVASTPFDLKGMDPGMRRTCSIGWAVYPWYVAEPEAVPWEDVLALADDALYKAKQEGRNQAIGMLPVMEKPPTPTGADGGQTHPLPVQTLHTPGPHLAVPDTDERGQAAAASAPR